VSSLFQSFYQVDPSFTRTFGGTGLGLVISKRLAELMDGEIAVTSELGKGTTVTFSVSCRVADPGASTGDAALAAKLANATVLVVDDNLLDRHGLSTILRPHGCRVVTAVSGEEAIAAVIEASAAGIPVDVVLMDWRMPGIDGLQTAQRLKADPTLSRPPAVVLISGFEREEVMTHLNDPALDGFLIKPIEEALLMKMLSDVFSQMEGRHLGHRQPSAGAARFAGRKVLLAEDNEINREIAAEMLRSMGVSVTMAVNGSEALDLAGRQTFDLILMDIQMPLMDGLSATKLMRADPELRHVPIIALTAHAMSGDRERSLLVGMNDHIVKPVELETLAKALRQWLPERAPTRSGQASSPAPRPADEPGQPFDMRAALERASGNAALLRRMLIAFCEHFTGAPAELRTLVSAGDLDDAAKLAHTLKGSAATLSALALTKAAGDLEAALGAGHIAKLPALLADVDAKLAAAMAFAAAWNPATDPLAKGAPKLSNDEGSKRAGAALRPTLLLVEDDPATLQLLQATFNSEYNLLFAINGECAMELAALKAPDLVLLDITLPGIDGFEVCRRLKTAPGTRDIPVIFITGAEGANSEMRALHSGAMDYVNKPIAPADLRERVRTQIRFPSHAR
jgi:CheY-like chemotaxis protein